MHLLDSLLPWITQYGVFALFVLLALGIVALPIPDESLLVASGYLLATGDLKPIPTAIAAVAGAWTGISISYALGHFLGYPLVNSRFGKMVGLQGKRFEKTRRWFYRIGKWSLVIGYFIPGIRHIVGYMAGMLSFKYRQFMLFAYSGGAIWAILFLSVGYILHEHGTALLEHMQSMGLTWFE
jgi:membrane protein DedA with SNARE-associated domain